MTEKTHDYIKSCFTPSNIDSWYKGTLITNENQDDEIELKQKNNRSTTWRSLILKRYKRCIVTGLDSIECDAAHIVPFNECKDLKETWGTDKANGLLLSKNLHWTFDRFYWSLDPNDILKDDDVYTWLRIIMKNTKRKLSIAEYCKKNNADDNAVQPMIIDHENIKTNTYGYVRIFKDCIPFIKIHYESFLDKSLTTHIKKQTSNNKTIVLNCRIIKRKFDNKRDHYLYQCLADGDAFSNTKWLSEPEGIKQYGPFFSTIIDEFNRKMEEFDDPTWEPL